MSGSGTGRTSFVKFGIIMMICLLITNIIMMVALQQRASETTVILREFNKISGDTSDQSPPTNRRKELTARDKQPDVVIREAGNGRQEKSRGVHGNSQRRRDPKEPIKRISEGRREPDEHGGVSKDQKGGDVRQESDIHRPNGATNDDIRVDMVKKAERVGRLTLFNDPDIDRMIAKLNSSRLGPFFPNGFWTVDFQTFANAIGNRKRSEGSTLANVKRVNLSDKSIPSWRRFHANIRRYALYDPRDPAIDRLLEDMATLPIRETDDTDSGTQLKVFATLQDGGRAVMKPMRLPRGWPVNPNIYVFDDEERHFSEIAAFHLDRLLGFYRVPPTVGRKINLTEFYEVAPKSVRNTYFTSPAGNQCFFGKCDYFCDSAFPFCGNPDVLEVSMMAYLPSRLLAKRESWYQPYRRSYSKWRKAAWEKDEKFCDSMKKTYPYNTGKLLNDMIDAHTFDFLNGNKDRHSFAFFKEFGNFSFPILYDNGRGYGQPDYDPMSILAPLRQCCRIRKSTFLKYVKLYSGSERLSALIERSLSRDPVSPVLIEGHLYALDRRLVKLLKVVATCLENHPVNQVIIYDSY